MSDNQDEALPITPQERDRLFEAACDGPMALCVSGGPDSMALMYLAAEWCSSSKVESYWRDWWDAQQVRHSKLSAANIDIAGLPRPDWLTGIRTREQLLACGGPPRVVVLSVDHGLREESAAEAQFVADEAEKLGLPHQVLRWTGNKPSSGLQEAARDARRRLILEVLRAESGIVGGLAHGEAFAAFRRDIFMAHHLEDQAETFLMRLARGSGIEGLVGMRACGEVRHAASDEQPQTFQYGVRRPFLGVAKARLKASLRARGAAWIEDPSNEDEHFERVRVRRVMTQLEPLGFTAERIAHSVRRLQAVESGLQSLTKQWSPVRWHCGLFGEIGLDDGHLRESYLLERTLRQVIRAFGGAAREPELAQIEKLAGLALDLEARMGCGGLTLGGCKIEFAGEDAGVLRIYREGKGEGLAVVPFEDGRPVDWDGGRFTVFPDAEMCVGAAIRPLGAEGWARLKRQVPQLAVLRWPAAALATIPVIERQGAVVAFPALDEIMRCDKEEIPQAVREAWQTWASSLDGGYFSDFYRYRFEW
jgi:tRNA(Ile)-lysidine synthase